MFLLRLPKDEEIRRLIARQADAPYSYAEVGATRGAPPGGYDFDTQTALLGAGENAWNRAKAAISRWKMFPERMCRLYFDTAPIKPGQVVVVAIRTFGLWSLNPARIVYTIDEQQPEARFGFAYGTLADHVERGEELFSVERRADDTVWYSLAAFSRPRHLLARLGYPYARSQQARFRRLSVRAMHEAVRSGAV